MPLRTALVPSSAEIAACWRAHAAAVPCRSACAQASSQVMLPHRPTAQQHALQCRSRCRAGAGAGHLNNAAHILRTMHAILAWQQRCMRLAPQLPSALPGVSAQVQAQWHRWWLPHCRRRWCGGARRSAARHALSSAAYGAVGRIGGAVLSGAGVHCRCWDSACLARAAGLRGGGRWRGWFSPPKESRQANCRASPLSGACRRGAYSAAPPPSYLRAAGGVSWGGGGLRRLWPCLPHHLQLLEPQLPEMSWMVAAMHTACCRDQTRAARPSLLVAAAVHARMQS